MAIRDLRKMLFGFGRFFHIPQAIHAISHGDCLVHPHSFLSPRFYDQRRIECTKFFKLKRCVWPNAYGGSKEKSVILYEYNEKEHKQFVHDWFSGFSGYLHVDGDNFFDLEWKNQKKMWIMDRLLCNTIRALTGDG